MYLTASQARHALIGIVARLGCTVVGVPALHLHARCRASEYESCHGPTGHRRRLVASSTQGVFWSTPIGNARPQVIGMAVFGAKAFRP
jgi:hypothetical protein